jgi:peptidoglycan-N-acetylglucosamine deacetylase
MRSRLTRVIPGVVLGAFALGALSLTLHAAEPAKSAAPAKGTASAPAPAAIAKIPPCTANPDGLGVSRIVEIDTTGGPGFGFEHYKAYDFLQDKEVVLTFDDGPWPGSTKSVLESLASHCTKGTFFSIGKHALYHPEILKQVAAAGHTVGTHTFSHVDLSKMEPDKAKEEIEKGFSAVKLALGAAPASFFRFPQLRDPPDMVAYLGSRNVGIFSTDIDSFDFKFGKKPEAIVKTVMDKLEKKGKGILLKQMKAKGYNVVHLKSKVQATTIATFDADIEKGAKGLVTGTANGASASSVIKTIADQ